MKLICGQLGCGWRAVEKERKLWLCVHVVFKVFIIKVCLLYDHGIGQHLGMATDTRQTDYAKTSKMSQKTKKHVDHATTAHSVLILILVLMVILVLCFFRDPLNF